MKKVNPVRRRGKGFKALPGRLFRKSSSSSPRKRPKVLGRPASQSGPSNGVKYPFKFYTRLHLREPTGKKARSLFELVEHIKRVPGSVIYHHTHHFLQQHLFLSPEPPNDFAYWVTEVLGEEELGEKLASIDTCEFSTIRSLRERIVETVEGHLKTGWGNRRVPEGAEFYFIKSISFVLPTPYVAHNLPEFLEILKKITVNSLYYHIFEARLRLETRQQRQRNDFSNWIANEIGDKELAMRISRLDPYTYTLEGLRAKIIEIIKDRLKAREEEA